MVHRIVNDVNRKLAIEEHANGEGICCLALYLEMELAKEASLLHSHEKAMYFNSQPLKDALPTNLLGDGIEWDFVEAQCKKLKALGFIQRSTKRGTKNTLARIKTNVRGLTGEGLDTP